MITIPTIVEEIIKASPVLEETLARGFINSSSLAREIKPTIEKRLYKEVQLGAVIMALNRLAKKLSKDSHSSPNTHHLLGDITVRSGITEFTFRNSPTLNKTIRKLFDETINIENRFLTVSEGVFETTIFCSQTIQPLIPKLFAIENQKFELTNLSSITVILSEEAVYVPGVYYSILKTLAWEGISFVEVISSFTELTIFLEDKNVDKAFSALKKSS